MGVVGNGRSLPRVCCRSVGRRRHRYDRWLTVRFPMRRKTHLKMPSRATYQAMEALVHNLNTMHSRAGAQTPFSSVNYGMDTSPEGRMVIRERAACHGGGLGVGRNAHLPGADFPREGGRKLQSGRFRTTTCSAWPCAVPPRGCSPISALWTRRSTCRTTRARPKRRLPTWDAARVSWATL